MKINSSNTKIQKINQAKKVQNDTIYAKIEQKQDEFKPQKKTTFKEKLSAFGKKFKTVIVSGVSILVGALSVFAVMNKKTSELEKENTTLCDDNRILQKENRSLVEQKKELENSKKALEEEQEILQKKLKMISLPEDYDKRIEKKLDDTQIRATLPINREEETGINHEKIERIYDKIGYKMSSVPEQTNNRANMIDLVIPEFKSGKPYKFEFPESEEIKLTHESCQIKPIPLKSTNISASYTDSLNWDNNKIARDLLQNFFDGHGQTLDGVKFDVQPNEDGTYKVRIEGKSTYTPTKAILLGESSKKDDKHAAGQFGEGSKMIALKLLAEKGADKVNVGSDNWILSWQLPESEELDGTKVLSYQLDETESFNGNFVEFNTNNEDLIKSIIGSFNNFYHSNNPSFKCPQFENEKLGVRILDKNEKGKMFIAGQAFEVDGSYTGLEGIEIFLKEKPPVQDNGTFIFDPSRDRTSLNSKNIEAIGNWLSKRENLSDDDFVKLLHTLEPYWEVRPANDKSNEGARAFLNGLIERIAFNRSGFFINFPDKKCIADCYGPSANLKQFYKDAGYKICSSPFGLLGMKSIRELIDETRKHTELEPTELEKKKIILIKDAIKLLAPKLQEVKLFESKELDPIIKIFDKSSEIEDEAYQNVAAEAIIDKGKSIGFWVDKSHLNSSFTTLLSTALHELTHKYGGDESSNFSYKLTDVLETVLGSVTDDASIAKELKILEGAWKKLEE